MLPAGPPWTTKHSDEAELKTTAIPRRQDQQVLRPLSHGDEGSSLAKNLDQPSPSVVTNAPHSCQVLIIEEAVCRGGGGESWELHFLLNFPIKLRLLLKT